MKQLLFLALTVFWLSGCASYDRCRSKYAQVITDTSFVQVPVHFLVPRDSVITSFVTDTTYLYKEIQTGRSKVIVERTNTITTVSATCDTVTVEKLVTVQVPAKTINWGVAPYYKTAFRVMTGVAVCAIIALIILCIILSLRRK